MTNAYLKGKVTVLLNMSTAVLMLPLKTINGKSIVLHPRKGRSYVDVEDTCEEKNVRAAMGDLEGMVERGMLMWCAKGSRPKAPAHSTAMRLPGREGDTVVAPPNEFDKALNDLSEKERQQDERTKTSSGARREPEAPRVIGGGEGLPQTRFADPAKGEVDAATSVRSDGENPPMRAVDTPAPFDATPVGELVDAAIANGVLTKKGTYLQLNGESIGNGRKAACEALEAQTDLLSSLRSEMNARASVGTLA